MLNDRTNRLEIISIQINLVHEMNNFDDDYEIFISLKKRRIFCFLRFYLCEYMKICFFKLGQKPLGGRNNFGH